MRVGVVEARRRRQTGADAGAAAQAHDGAGSAAPYLGIAVGRGGHQSGQANVFRRQISNRGVTSDQYIAKLAKTAAAVPARYDLGIRRVGGRAGRHCRARERDAAGSFYRRTHHRAAEAAGHRICRASRACRARCARAARRTEKRGAEYRAGHRRCKPSRAAAAAWCPPQPTTRASASSC